MMDEGGIPIEEQMEVYEKDDIRQAAEACMEEIPSWMYPKLEECLEEEDWANNDHHCGLQRLVL
jgi:hypothetical protein